MCAHPKRKCAAAAETALTVEHRKLLEHFELDLRPTPYWLQSLECTDNNKRDPKSEKGRLTSTSLSMLTRGSCLRSIFYVDNRLANQATTRVDKRRRARALLGIARASAAYVKSCVDTCQRSVANLSICQTRGIKKWWSIAYRLFRPSPGICAPTQPSASRSSLHGTDDRPTRVICHKVPMLPPSLLLLRTVDEPL